MALGNDSNVDVDSEAAQAAAATVIQRVWRSKNNKAKDEHMNPELRWEDAATHAKLTVDRTAALNGRNSPQRRWRRAAFFIAQMTDKDDMLSRDGVKVDAEEKHLETQHWLELVDGKHRYGSNLKWYHQRWQEDDTTENFFKWLDYGGGKDLSLDECSRERLEQERIIYLSAEQRLNYLVKISDDGKLLWAKNNQPVDTTAGHWKDTGDGQGIVPQNMPSKPASETRNSEPFTTSVACDSSEDQDNAATHYAGQPTGKHGWSRYLRRHFTLRGMMERLLRKTVKRNTWIYVSDKNFNIFIGIKETGAFQHSSFISGGIVTSAGLISVKEGVIHTLSPLSGHYRTTIDHFRKFIDVLTERGVDMHKVQVSKAEAALWGIEHLAKFKKAKSKAISSGKDKVKQVPHDIKVFLAEKSPGDTRWKKEILMGRKPSHPANDANRIEDKSPQANGEEPSAQINRSQTTPGG